MGRFLFGLGVMAVVGCAGMGGGGGTDRGRDGESVRSGDYALPLPLGLQAGSAYIPEKNPLTQAKIDLGRLLYFDKRLSTDDTVSCATCHDPAHGFAEPRKTSQGVGAKVGARNAPTVINRLFSADQFWDGRAADLEEQSKGPIVNPIEMATRSHGACEDKLRGVPGYAPLFTKAFGSTAVTIDRIAQAIASYERTVVSGDSPYDRYQAGERTALSPAAVAGMTVFNGKGNCVTCHAGFNFTDESYHNLGVGMTAKKPDLGRAVVTKAKADTGAFKTPTLREIARTAPYMHDGSEATLADVVAFYDRGGNKNRYLAKEMRPLGLSTEEKANLVAFLQALTGRVPAAGAPTTFPQ